MTSFPTETFVPLEVMTAPSLGPYVSAAALERSVALVKMKGLTIE